MANNRQKQRKRSRRRGHAESIVQKREAALNRALAQVRRVKDGSVHKQDTSKFLRLMAAEGYEPSAHPSGWRAIR